ncbi:tetratricopeptide repeat protein [Cohaesibacter sp. CAU 1516]|uniref:tetratricopeptide repeat protein n=1 Tax=Cohaesibacter sp. CAU 1516 TaxID=2576038 RepID=UPI0010FEDD32|nr:tetratricopeptide repeat protein [Cohaesibacter sp. CAU 1516]TLP45542.1 tetratricopeptide repeat protein [Cohaesibacter sp. CAU 1516]
MKHPRRSSLFRQFLLAGICGLALLSNPASGRAAQQAMTELTETLADLPVTLTGSYLSARIAQQDQDLGLAAHFFAQAMELDPTNPLLLERNFALTLATGQHDLAFKLADRMEEITAREAANLPDKTQTESKKDDQGDAPSSIFTGSEAEYRIKPMISMALGVKALKGKNYASAVKSFGDGLDVMQNHPVDLLGPAPFRRSLNNPRLFSASAQFGPFAVISQTVLKAWSLIGQDRANLDAALALLDTVDEGQVNQFFFSMHSGLIAAYAKDYEKAAQHLQQSLDADPNSPITAYALINSLLKGGNTERATEVLAEFDQSAADEADKDWIRSAFAEMKPAASMVRTPQDGAAELFGTLGDALAQENAIEGGALYLQFSDFLRADFDRTEYALARLHERMKQDTVALEHYDQVTAKSPIHRRAVRQSGFVLTRLKRPEDAIERLNGLLAGDASDLETVSVLSRVYQSEDRYRDAIKVLSAGIDSIKSLRDFHWSLFFLRGSAYDQVKDWDNTEKDMQKALELFPNQPTVLNYLGYSWVDRGLNLDQAIEMIRQAVALRPYDGFFVDSLGWAHFRLSQFEEAVKFLERAVELRPEDPTITDHLGDAYWMTGRKNEARFQWQRVKTMSPKPELLVQVENKIANGLDEGKLPEVKKN